MLKLLQKVRGNMSVSRAIVFKWHSRFKDDCQTVEDNGRQGREVDIHTSSATSIKMALEGDHGLTIRNGRKISTLEYTLEYNVII